MSVKKYMLILCIGCSILLYNNCGNFELSNDLTKTNNGTDFPSLTDNTIINDTSTNPTTITPVKIINHFDKIQQLSSGRHDTTHVSDFSNYISERYKLFWHLPTRAYPGIDIDFQLIYYEADNQPIEFSLKNAPAGMKISSGGQINWTPSNAQTGSHNFVIQLKRADGQSISKTATIKVNTSDFIFVSPSGSNSNNGSRQSPYRSIQHAVSKLTSNQGKTIYLDSGTYKEHASRGDRSWFSGKKFSADSPLVIQGLPGKSATIDCEGLGSGLVLSGTSYVAVKNMSIINARDGDGGGIIVWSKKIVLQKVAISDAYGDAANNVTGFLINAGDVVLDRCRAENNIDSNNMYFHNNSNFLFYTEANNGKSNANQTDFSTMWVLNSYSSGSHIGFKIKHAGSKKLIIHNSVSEEDIIGFGLSSTHSSVRYSMAINNKFAGIKVGIVDLKFGTGSDNDFAKGQMLIEHNLIYDKKPYNSTMLKNSGPAPGLLVDSYWAKKVNFHKNIIINDNGGFRPVMAWPYLSSTNGLVFNASKNIYFYKSSKLEFRVLRKMYLGLSAWKNIIGSESQTRTENPNLKDLANFDFQPTAGSSAIFSNGEFAGPIKPSY